ncbi:MAG: hypothetical protein AAB112_05065 [Thermodesulfobacteriota bacterium]
MAALVEPFFGIFNLSEVLLNDILRLIRLDRIDQEELELLAGGFVIGGKRGM